MAYKTCVSVAEFSSSRLVSTLKKAMQKSDYAELRLDFLKPIQIPDVLEKTKRYHKRCVCTLRPKSEGGRFSGTENERISILKLISEYNPYMIDIEYSTLSKNKSLLNYVKKTKTKILVSWHDFKKTPSTAQLLQRLQNMQRLSKYIKIVTTANSIKDTASVLSLYRKQDPHLIAFAMGDYGRISRILCMHLGSPYTYVSLDKPVAPGQFSVDEVKSLLALQK